MTHPAGPRPAGEALAPTHLEAKVVPKEDTCVKTRGRQAFEDAALEIDGDVSQYAGHGVLGVVLLKEVTFVKFV